MYWKIKQGVYEILKWNLSFALFNFQFMRRDIGVTILFWFRTTQKKKKKKKSVLGHIHMFCFVRFVRN